MNIILRSIARRIATLRVRDNFWWAVPLSTALYLLLSLLPDALIVPLLCRIPAELTTLWLGVPLDRAALTYSLHGQTFLMARSCAAEGFFAMALAFLLCRAPKWWWLAYPLTLLINTMRITATSTLTPLLQTFRYERLLHLSIGTCFFVCALCALWFFLERLPYARARQ